MSNFVYHDIAIDAIAVAVPNDCQMLSEYASLYPAEEFEKYCKTTGFSQRYVGYRKKIIASDLCVTAANHIFERFAGSKDEIDAIIFMSQSFDYEGPATSGVIQMRLGLERCGPVYDVLYGCAAFPFGLQMAASFICGGCRKVLLLNGDSVTSQHACDKDSLLFGDAGCAVVLGKSDGDTDPIQISLETMGNKYKMLMAPFGGQRHRFYDMVDEVGLENALKLQRRYMNGADVFTFSIKDAPAATKRFFEAFQCGPEDFDLAAIHQANRMIVDNIAKRIKFPKEKVHISLDRFANVSGASVPLGICDYFEQHPDCGKKRVLGLGFGVGMSIGVCSCYIDSATVLPVIKSDETYDDGISCQEYL